MGELVQCPGASGGWLAFVWCGCANEWRAERCAKLALNFKEAGQLRGLLPLGRGKGFLLDLKEDLPRGDILLPLFQACLIRAQAARLLGELSLPGGELGLADLKFLPLQATLLGQLGLFPLEDVQAAFRLLTTFDNRLGLLERLFPRGTGGLGLPLDLLISIATSPRVVKVAFKMPWVNIEVFWTSSWRAFSADAGGVAGGAAP